LMPKGSTNRRRAAAEGATRERLERIGGPGLKASIQLRASTSRK
jgi:hypothetical protein